MKHSGKLMYLANASQILSFSLIFPLTIAKLVKNVTYTFYSHKALSGLLVSLEIIRTFPFISQALFRLLRTQIRNLFYATLDRKRYNISIF